MFGIRKEDDNEERQEGSRKGNEIVVRCHVYASAVQNLTLMDTSQSSASFLNNAT